MPRPKNVVARAETANDIKRIARQQLADKGTNGISLRGIARELGMTAPAIYNYFPKLDDLITALLVDAFSGHANAIENAIDAHEHPKAQFQAGIRAYRQWALEQPSDFQLIYGNPIPGYEAPREITVPLASRPQELLVRCLVAAQEIGALTVPATYQTVPESITEHVAAILYSHYPEIQAITNHMALFYMVTVGWSRIQGIIMLEIHKHLAPTIGDVDTFFEQEVESYMIQIGFNV
ncbi:MAG: TetR/AcrR family transcriptional regulator [Chloroflexota bacterium]